MSWIAGGRFAMGSDRHYAEERPAHPVSVDGFWIDTRAVTNAEFAAFVAATGYVTLAERPLDPALTWGFASQGCFDYEVTATFSGCCFKSRSEPVT